MSKEKVRNFTEKQIEINRSNAPKNVLKRRLKMSKPKVRQKCNVLTTWQAYDVAPGRKEAN